MYILLAYRSLAPWITAAHAEIIHIHKVSIYSDPVSMCSFGEYKDKPIEWLQTSFATSKFKHGEEILQSLGIINTRKISEFSPNR